MMRRLLILALLLPVSALADNTMWGQWTGQIKPDKEKLMRAAKLPEHRELLDYAIKRLAQSRVSLYLNSDGSFDYTFDDGYAADKATVSGLWKATQTALSLTMGRGPTSHTDKLPITDGGKHILTNYNDIDGVPIIFTHQSPPRQP